MKNYICLNGKKAELTAEQLAALGINKTMLKDVPVGETFKIEDCEFVVLEHSKETTAVILKSLLCKDERFGDNNNYSDSHVDILCRAFGETLERKVGKENLVEHTVDLTADDGLKCYGKIKRKVSLLTANLYRRYVDILDRYNPEKWWWLATPYSTPKHGGSSRIKCVSPSGFIDNRYYIIDDGVRPFCIFDSNIFVDR